jgi:type I restriction enzyme S subunit
LKNDCVLSGIRFYNEICLLLQISHLGKEGKVRRIHPQGWVAASLKQIAAINPRHPKGLDDSMPISFVRMAAVSESNPQFDSLEVRKLGEVRKGFTHFAEGDVVFAKITPCMENGKGAVATGLQNGIGCGTTELHVIRPLGGIDPHYVYRFLAQSSVRRAAKENFTGTAGQARVPTSFIEELELPLAPLAEQRRIVAKLAKLLGQVNACQQRLEKMPTLLKRFRQSILAAACSGRLTADWREQNPQNDAERVDVIKSGDLPEGWRMSTVERLAKIGSGQSSKLIISKCETTGEIPWFKVSDMNLDGNEKFMRSSQNYLSQDNAEMLGMKIYPAGTIIFPKRGGAIATNKKRILIQPSCIDSNTMALTPHSCFGDYFWAWFTTMDLGILADGSSVPQINNPDIQPLEVPLPPLAEQQEIVRRVAGLFALADQLELRLAQARKQVAKLTPSLLARAFAGQLVPQNPADEPAEKLLERIKTC